MQRHDLDLPELTLRGMLLGAALTVIFTASNVYLGLKVGITFSSAIPAAIISMAILRMAKGSNILENNIVQTQASAAGTLSAIIFIIPGMLMVGYWHNFEFWQTLLVSACGGCLGVFFTIPLRRAMVVHSDLPYPEGLAAAEILKVGSAGNSGGIRELLTGGGIAGGLALLAGMILAWGGMIPYFTMTGTPADGQTLQEFAQVCYKDRVRLIGAGVMGVAAIWTLIKLARPVFDGVKESIQFARVPQEELKQHRTDRDMSVREMSIIFTVMFVGLLGTFYSLVSADNLPFAQSMIISLVGVLLALTIGFLVAAAAAYMAGLVGTSSSPISSIGILAIIISSSVIMMIFKSLGIFDMPGGEQFATATAIFTTSIVLAVACISNDNMQDLKTGFLVGATPRSQQIALLLGCLVGALVIAPVLNLLYQAYGFPGALPRPDMNPDNALAAPQATLMTMLAQGIFSSDLAWEYIYFGIGLGGVIVVIDSLLRKNTKNFCLPPLAVGIGIYLPPSLLTSLIVGAVMGYFLERATKSSEQEAAKHRGTLFASGLIVGESLVGVVIAAIIAVSITCGGTDLPLALVGDDFASTAEFLGLGVFAATLAIFYKIVRGKNF